jgi:hypothetical protein
MSNGKLKCKICGKSFTPTRDWQEYCTLDCGNKARARRRYQKVREQIKAMDEKREREAGNG